MTVDYLNDKVEQHFIDIKNSIKWGEDDSSDEIRDTITILLSTNENLDRQECESFLMTYKEKIKEMAMMKTNDDQKLFLNQNSGLISPTAVKCIRAFGIMIDLRGKFVLVEHVARVVQLLENIVELGENEKNTMKCIEEFFKKMRDDKSFQDEFQSKVEGSYLWYDAQARQYDNDDHNQDELNAEPEQNFKKKCGRNPRRRNPSLGSNEFPSVPIGIRRSSSEGARKLSDYRRIPGSGIDIGS
ncbi:unnamed protein product [Rotaria socialis]|uniref:Cdc37 Hsp90 binding domain-containing protein n=2 Tax=Rotaria socialis TaxID=392032 RepID=A0A818ZZJ3_9BILA|nr:unnamed protein product [Rotaria socialis]CAF3321956.1 unnamed protein product [Rotaria socialis]CAF3404162.1 unnamed protein product [Rotaria socialis]CAF3770891.1 unnamed protein product [Rotaria socialis]CAF4339320.1 unnamed protein product [Rotaria socialis]